MAGQNRVRAAAGDPVAMEHARNDANTERQMDLLFNKYGAIGHFDAICLSGGAQAEQVADPSGSMNTYYPIKIRPKEIHASILPDPCSKEYADESMTKAANKIIGLHPTAFSITPLSFGQRTVGFGETIKCHFTDAHPHNGKMRGLRYEFPTAPVSYNYECANATLQSLVGIVAQSNVSLLGGFAQSGTPGPANHQTSGTVTRADQYPGAVLPADMTKCRVTSRTGLRRDPVTGQANATHGGIDIAGPINSDLYAVLDGEVLDARGTTIGGKAVGGFGAWIVLKHPTKNGAGENKTIYTIYGHVAGSYVKKGDKVTKGQVIAPMGNEGKSTGPHLHFELHTGWGKTKNTRLDPIASFGWDI